VRLTAWERWRRVGELVRPVAMVRVVYELADRAFFALYWHLYLWVLEHVGP
jgi:hypothetical protein